YQIDDGQGGTDTAVVTYTVTGVNDAPIAVDPTQPVYDPNNPPTDPVTGEPLPFDPDTPFVPPVDDQNYIPEQSQTNLGTPIEDGTAVPPLDLTPYFGDPDAPDGVTLSIVPTDLPEGLTFDPVTNQITGTPEEDASQKTNVAPGTPGRTPGTYVIPVTATDPNGATFTTNVTYVVTNPAPVAVDDVFTGDEDTVNNTVNVFDGNPTTADSDPDGIAFTGPGQANPNGLDIFRVTRVVSGNDETALAAAADGDGVGTVVAGSNGGEFTLGADGSVTFDPKTDFNDLGVVNGVAQTRDTQVVYQIDDGQGGTDTAVVTYTVTGVNDAP
ncbi:MAG: putative Ig domain-containing protein, partial [Pseudomonadota bacterium]